MKTKLALTFAHQIIGMVSIDDNLWVACKIKDNSVTPYATWRVDDNGSCYWGHYFTTRAKAMHDLKERSGMTLF